MTSTTTTSDRPVITDSGPDATVCVIGAGAAGLAVGKALLDRGIAIDWFERGSMVGGLWQIDNDNGGAAAYESLHTNTSRTLTQYPSFPMPEDWPDFPSHELMAQYFESFADAFGLWEHIRFNTSVDSVARLDDGRWSVSTSDGATRTYEHVVVASGHHSVPKIPDIAGSFSGKTLHSHAYREPSIFQGKRVLVIGVGNSGMDIACEASRAADATYLSTRHGAHVIPKYVLGRPLDLWHHPFTAHVPFQVERLLYEGLIRLAAGTPKQRGLPTPDHRLLSAHPTVSSDLPERVGHGDVALKPDIASLDGTTATFVDGTSAEVDLVVFATGYQITFPFLDPDLITVTENELRLYQRVVPVGLPHLWFAGFVQAIGSGVSLFDYQAQWIADLIAGTCVLPDEAEMARWIEEDRRAQERRFVRSTRHTIQVDYWRYINALKAERARTGPPSGLLGRVRSLLPV